MNATILIVEGTSGVGKSTLIDAMLRNHIDVSAERKVRSLLHLAQTHTYGPLAIFEDSNTITKQKILEHLKNIYRLLKWMAASSKSEKKVNMFSIVDTLHLTHCVRLGALDESSLHAFDNQLKTLGSKLIFIRAAPSTIWERGIVPRKNEQFLVEYAKRFGSTLEEIHQYFVEEQGRLEVLAANSVMDKLILTAEDNFRYNVKKAYDFWVH